MHILDHLCTISNHIRIQEDTEHLFLLFVGLSYQLF